MTAVGRSATPGRLLDQDPVQSVVVAVVDSIRLRHDRQTGWPGQGVDASDLEFLLHDSGNTRTSRSVLLQHNPWSAVLEKPHGVVYHDPIQVLQTGDSTV